ncbi:hypothetical protein ACJX0J_026327, partial [Zea mays]
IMALELKSLSIISLYTDLLKAKYTAVVVFHICVSGLKKYTSSGPINGLLVYHLILQSINLSAGQDPIASTVDIAMIMNNVPLFVLKAGLSLKYLTILVISQHNHPKKYLNIIIYFNGVKLFSLTLLLCLDSLKGFSALASYATYVALDLVDCNINCLSASFDLFENGESKIDGFKGHLTLHTVFHISVLFLFKTCLWIES